MSEIAFAFQIGGKIINPEEVEDEALLEEINYVVGAILDQMGDLVCPEHKEAPRFLCTGDNFDDISVETHACCDELIKEVKKRMNV
ncbi:MAG: hypothetical protein OEV42_16655 [Deltaproteobacteria bacterium]|nr:hypothetical protein [Deltaproteobacteria bacterium]